MKIITTHDEAVLLYTSCQKLVCEQCVLEPLCKPSLPSVTIRSNKGIVRESIMSEIPTLLIQKGDDNENTHGNQRRT